MGKTKSSRGSSQKVKKEKAFVVSSMKKGKTKPIATNLKKLTVHQSKAKTAKADESFKALRKEMMDAASTSTKTPGAADKSKPSQKSKKDARKEAPVDMDMAVESFSKL